MSVAAEKGVPTLDEHSSSKNAIKSPRSLLGADPYGSANSGIDPYDVDGPGVDPYDINDNAIVNPNREHNRPNLRKPSSSQTSPPNNSSNHDNESWFEQSAPNRQSTKNNDSSQYKWPWDTNSVQGRKNKPPLNLKRVGSQLGMGYLGAFTGGVVGMFGGFVVGSLYGNLAHCSRCWLDYATAGSMLGATALTAGAVYQTGNSKQQLGSFYFTVVSALTPVILAEGLYSKDSNVKKGEFYFALMPIMATIGYNLSRHKRKPGEAGIFDKYLFHDGWVSMDPVNKVLAYNVNFHF